MLCQFVFFFIAHRRLKKKQPSYFPSAVPLPGPYLNSGHLFVLGLGRPLFGLVLDLKLLFTLHLHTVANKSTGVFCNIFSP